LDLRIKQNIYYIHFLYLICIYICFHREYSLNSTEKYLNKYYKYCDYERVVYQVWAPPRIIAYFMYFNTCIIIADDVPVRATMYLYYYYYYINIIIIYRRLSSTDGYSVPVGNLCIRATYLCILLHYMRTHITGIRRLRWRTMELRPLCICVCVWTRAYKNLLMNVTCGCVRSASVSRVPVQKRGDA